MQRNDFLTVPKKHLSEIFEEAEIDHLSQLPAELIIHILSFLPANDIKKIHLLSNLFYKISSACYSNSLYGRALRFNNWHKEQIKNFKKSTDSFNAIFVVNLRNRPDMRGLRKGLFYFQLGLLALASLTLIALFFLRIKITLSLTSKKKDFLMLFLKFAMPISLLLRQIINVVKTNRQINRANAAYLISPLQLSDLNKLENFIHEHSHFFENLQSNTLQAGTSTISQLLALANDNKEQIILLSEMLNDYLANNSRFSPRQCLSHEDLENLSRMHPKLPTYAKNISSFWGSKNSKGEQLVNEDVQSKDREISAVTKQTY